TIAFLIGWAMQAIMQLPSLFKRKYFYKPHLDLKDEGLKKILTLMIPVMVSTWIQPINLSISTRFASKFLDGGGVTIIEYANTLYSIIVGVFVLSIANVIFPRLSRIVIDKDTNKFNETITTILEIMSFLLIPMAVGVMCLSVPIVRLIFERGHFDSSGTAMTANALLFFALGMLGFGVQTILSRAYYAEKNGKIPLLSGLISVISNGILCFIMSPIWGISGLALASTISTFIAALVLVIPMHKKSGIISKKFITENFKMFLCAIVMAVGVIFTLTFLEGKFEYNLIGNILYAALPCAVGVLIYILMSIILKVSQAQTILELAKKILKGRKTV
ncbi:MAG: murein biosynthesis integral membrane protein MurJ, partial [Anaerotignaceae bacterium]